MWSTIYIQSKIVCASDAVVHLNVGALEDLRFVLEQGSQQVRRACQEKATQKPHSCQTLYRVLGCTASVFAEDTPGSYGCAYD